MNTAQENEKGDAKEATRERNDSRRAFADWLAHYQTLAKFALADRPDLLEQVGIVVRAE